MLAQHAGSELRLAAIRPRALRVLTLTRKAAGGGYVPDGIPRNMHQARAAYLIGRKLGMTADVALHPQAGEAELMRRPSRRGGGILSRSPGRWYGRV